MKKVLVIVLAVLFALSAAAVYADVTEFKEAPVLAEKVAAGELPPVEERLPKAEDVFVMTELKNGDALEIGNYGGTLTKAVTKIANWEICRSTTLERPVDFDTNGTPFNNVLKSIESNEDMTVWTMHLREGMKWSDGEPFTADDITFWYYMLHKNNYDGLAYWAACFQVIDGEEVWAVVDKVDDYTVTWTFAQPQYRSNFVDTGDMKWCWAPYHFWKDKVPSSYYMENPYWPDTGLTDEEVIAKFMEYGYEYQTAKDCGKSGYYSWNHYEQPTLSAYMLTTEDGFNDKSDPLVKLVRNPYYWKVDAEGNQLPYIDEIDFMVVSNSDQAILMLESADSEVDYTVVTIKDVVAIEDAMGDAVERHELTSTEWGDGQLYFNLTNKNLEMRDLVNNKSFRIAMSVAVDRDQVVNLWYDGLAEPANAAPQYPNFGYNEEWSLRYTQYDPEYAKKLLTEDCGLTMGSDGWFHFPSGEKVSLSVVCSDTTAAGAEKYAVLKQYWDAIGIEMNLNQADNYNTICDSNEGWDAAWGENEVNGYKIESRPKQFIPLNLAATWYSFYDTRGSAFNPDFFDLEGDLLKLYETYLEWLQIPELNDRDEKELEMMQILIDNTWFLAFTTAPSQYYMVRSGIGNWPESMPNEDKFNFQMQFGFNTLYFK